MKNGKISKYVYGFNYGTSYYEVIVKWVKDFYPFATKEIGGSEIKESEWKISIKSYNQYDPLFKGVSMLANFQEGKAPTVVMIGAELCKRVSNEMGFEFSHTFVEDAKMKKTETYNTSMEN